MVAANYTNVMDYAKWLIWENTSSGMINCLVSDFCLKLDSQRHKLTKNPVCSVEPTALTERSLQNIVSSGVINSFTVKLFTLIRGLVLNRN